MPKSPDLTTIPKNKQGDMIRYGRELIIHTANYFGPGGSIAKISNGMNCQNCHPDAGNRLFGNNFFSFIAKQPQMSPRSGKLSYRADRIKECFERSMNGRSPDTTKKEVQAMIAYLQWIGKGTKKGEKPYGSSTEKLPFLAIAANPAKGKAVYALKCKSCHGNNGEGLPAADKRSYIYPPLWGGRSYNDGAGMYRISFLAGFVKNNMPFGTTYKAPQLTNDEAWNVAAFINSQPRPHRDIGRDWPDLSKKPFDIPFGPYNDKFREKQHKFGPYQPIVDAQNTKIIHKT